MCWANAFQTNKPHVSINKITVQLYLVFKRIFDVVISIIALVFFAIPFAVIALAIKLDSPGPVYFRQDRVGKHGKPFKIWKFRTMIHDPTRIDPQPPPRSRDKLVTRVGHKLRRLGLDELPQLINVLRGELSLVGPRPVHPHRADRFNKQQRRRHLVKPGITGWALIQGRNQLTWKEKIKCDLWYVNHASFWLDLLILWRTPFILLRGEGVYMDQQESLAQHPNSHRE